MRSVAKKYPVCRAGEPASAAPRPETLVARPPYKGLEHGTTSVVLEFWGTPPKPMLSPTLQRPSLHHDPA